MKIIVLGNGFDLGNGLKTSYDDFFESKKDIIDIIIKFQKKLIRREYSVEDFYDYNYEMQMTVNEILSELYIELGNEVRNEVDMEAAFWYAYFYSKKNMHHWCAVENEIKNLVNNKQTIEEIRTSIDIYYPHDLIQENESILPDVRMEINKEDSEKDIFYLCDTKRRKYIFYNTLLNCFQGMSIFDKLMYSLKAFEKAFQEYIAEEYRQLYKEEKLKKYYNNFSRIFNKKERNEVFVLNFNYTKIDIFEIVQDFEKTYKLVECNVHGDFSSSIIFGIDSSTVEINEDKVQYIFTKTYRKMNEMENIISYKLPFLDNEYDVEIIFYGHSLSDADYSYFQSIFDFYDIYNNNITLVFKYSFYGDKKNHHKQKKEYLNNVTKLMEKYGKTFDNKMHGKNLLHKLLLENRIKIEEISNQIQKVVNIQ